MGRVLEPTGRWILVTAPAYYSALPEELARNDGLVTWSAPRQLAVGDLALLYQSSPSKEFKWLLRARSEPVPDSYFGHMAWFEALGFEHGVGFAEAVADPAVSAFPKMKARLVGSNHVVPEGPVGAPPQHAGRAQPANTCDCRGLDRADARTIRACA